MGRTEPEKEGGVRGVVVTGAAGDLGRAVAASFLADGYRVYGADIAPIEPKPGLVPLTLDVTARPAVFALAERAAAETALWAWINAAGIVTVQAVEDADPEAWARIIAVNLGGTFNGCAAALSVLKRTGGRIVNVGSISGQVGGVGPHPAYGASKAGVHALTKSYALAGARYGITCNAVAPSVLEGHMGREFSAAQLEKLVRSHPLRRLGHMAEVVHAIRYLADPGASFTNGVILPVNGAALTTG
ncbi:MAG TPA: SDR family oxidoreductase [Alphaproteobacteria bacterium]|nr:SDR family oxidoreductase [Alphaproteobacteria bacterium]